MGVMVTFVSGPRDGEQSKVVSGEPPGVLIVDDSGGVYPVAPRCDWHTVRPWTGYSRRRTTPDAGRMRSRGVYVTR